MQSDFTDQITNSKWRTDEAFVQRRLAFECPFTLRKVVDGDDNGFDISELVKVMNPKIEELEVNIGEETIDFDKV